jgi:hypothetical protein
MNTKCLSLRRASGSPIRVWVSISTRRFGDERSSPERSGLLASAAAVIVEHHVEYLKPICHRILHLRPNQNSASLGFVLMPAP